MKNILVPTDFSEQAQFALDMAHAIALKTSAEVKLLNVLELPVDSSFDASGEITQSSDVNSVFAIQLMERVKTQLDELVKDPKFKDIKVTGDVVIGNPYVNISKVIADQDVDLVIMGTQGSSGLKEILVGSNTEKVVRRAKCPVITVKQAVNIESVKNIVFASDFRDDLAKLVEPLQKLQKVFDAKLHIVSVNTPSNFENSRYYKKAMETFVEKNNIKNYSLHVYAESGEEDGIIYFAEDINADMIAIATHGRSGFSHILSGSLAEDIVNHAKRPVWTFNIHN